MRLLLPVEGYKRLVGERMKETLLDAEPLPLLAAIGILIVIAALAGVWLRARKKRKSRRAAS